VSVACDHQSAIWVRIGQNEHKFVITISRREIAGAPGDNP
jgi:hypothetical protein